MINTVLNLLFPVDCVLCAGPVKDWRSGALCEACEGQLLPQNSPCCVQCGLPATAIEGLCGACTTGKTQFDFGRSALVFDDNLRQVIHHFKYNDRVSLARPLGRALQACLDREPFTAEVVVPVPLHRTRERKRGFNQSALLGGKLNRRLKLNLVRRRRNTDSQTGLTRSQRARNVRAAFECRRPIEGTVLLVDDVQTTGATINEVARVLRRSGASRIEVVTLTRAGVTGTMNARS